MSKMSFLDKLGILVNLTNKYSIYLLIFLVLLIIGILIGFTNKKHIKFVKIVYFLIMIGLMIFMISSYHSSLGNMFSYMMNNFFIAVFFPTIAIYLAAIIAMNIIVWISIFSYKTSKPIKVLNISIYVIMNYLMALLLKVVNVKKLDIFDQLSLYGNKQVTALIELSSILFLVWIIFLILYKIILIYIRKDYKPKVKRIIVRKEIKKLPENYEPLLSPEMVYGNAPSEKVIDLKGRTEEEVLLEKFSKQFTLEDYKLFSRLLKEEQDRQHKKEEKKVEFVKEDSKVTRKQPKKPLDEKVVEEDRTYREQQKKEIIRMEQERRELLRREKQKQLVEKKKEQQAKELRMKQESEEEKEQRKLTELEMLYR